MKSANIKSIFAVVAVVALVSMLSSCNRGYGCPYKMQAKTEVRK